MAKIPMYDPLSKEARSSWLAGLTEAANKLSGLLEMKTETLNNLPLPELFISEDDRYRIYQAPLGNKLWLASPTPVIKKNGIVITPDNDYFTVDYLGGSVVFDENHRLTAGDSLTVDAVHIVEGSGKLEDLTNDIDATAAIAEHYRGYFATYAELAAITGVNGDFAIVGGAENMIYVYDESETSWVATQSKFSIDNTLTRTGDVLGVALPTKAVTQEEYDALTDEQKQSETLYVITDDNEQSGSAQHVRYSNPNLLDNWYFADPINQQRQTEYIGRRYSIDRWQVEWNSTLEIVEGGIVLSGDWNVSQRLEKGLSGTYTLSVLARRKTGADDIRLSFKNYSTQAGFYSDMSKNLVEGDNWGLLSATGLVNGANEVAISYLGGENNSMEILAVKLEQGGNQTLAHQDADGTWVLNDPPSNKPLELLKCQRHYQMFSSEALRPTNAVDFRPVMRINPTLGTINIDGETYYTADANL